MSSSTSPFKLWLPLALLLLGCLVGMSLLVGFNFQVDRWGVYHSDSVNFVDRGPPNVVYLKTRYLLEDPVRRDCLVLGSSRVEVLDMELFPGNCYNFNHPFGSLTKNLAVLRELVAAGKAPSIVFLGLDDASYTITDSNAPGSQPAPSNLLEALQFHARHLLRNPQWVDLDIASGGFGREDMPWVILDPQLELPELRAQARKYFDDPVGQDKRLKKLPATRWGRDDAVDEALDVMAGFRELAQQAGIELRLFFNPMHYRTYLQIDHELFDRFRRGLAPILPFHDFSGLHKAALDNRYWKETSHYSTRLGDAVAACLTGGPQPGNLSCTIVDESTLEDHLRQAYVRDARALLENEHFLGATFIPAALGEFMLGDRSGVVSRPVAEPTAGVQYRALQVYEQEYLHAEGLDPQLLLTGNCFDPQRSYLLQLDLEYVKNQRLAVYSPDEQGRFSADGRDLLDVDAGHQRVNILLRGMDCRDRLRFDPLPNRGDFFWRGTALYQLALEPIGS